MRLTFRKPNELRPGIAVDSDYATNNIDRKSVIRNVYTLGGMITNWLLKTGSVVSLLRSEVEYYSLGAVVHELICMCMLMEEFGYDARPVILAEDNQGCIFLIQNQVTGLRTKHLDVKSGIFSSITPQD